MSALQVRRRRPKRRPDELDMHALVEEHARVVWRFAAGMLRDVAEADDVCQETFVRALHGLDGFRGEASERTWLLTICRNVCIDRFRAQRDIDSLERLSEEGYEPDGALGDLADGVTDRLVLDEAVAALPSGEREAFLLVDVLQMTSAEASAVCGVPASTLRSRRHRAHRQLVARIGGTAHVD